MITALGQMGQSVNAKISALKTSWIPNIMKWPRGTDRFPENHSIVPQ